MWLVVLLTLVIIFLLAICLRDALTVSAWFNVEVVVVRKRQI